MKNSEYQGYWENEISEFVSIHGNQLHGHFIHENGSKVCDVLFYIDKFKKLHFEAAGVEYTSPSAAILDMAPVGINAATAAFKILGGGFHIYKKLYLIINEEKASLEDILNDMGIDISRNVKGKPTGFGRWYNFEELPARKSIFDLYGMKIGVELMAKGFNKNLIVADLDLLTMSDFRKKYKLV